MGQIKDGYIAAMLHDLGKRLLNAKAGASFGTWGPRRPGHARLDCLHERASGALPVFTYGLSEDILSLIAAHHEEASPPRGHPVAHWALVFADRAHKAMYFAYEGSGQIDGVNWHCPQYFPFWGRRRDWTPDTTKDFYGATDGKPSLLEGMQRLGREPNPESLCAVNRERLSDFPDSTFLPITSLHFHHQLVAALFLMTVAELRRRGVSEGGEVGAISGFELHVRLTTVTVPPETLRYRLRDALHLRKISDTLLAALHQHFRERYLGPSDFAEGDFSHPDFNPFLFYGRDAIVLLHPDEDYEAICTICQQTADDMETHFLLDSRRMAFRRGQDGMVRAHAELPVRHVTEPCREFTTEPTGRCMLCGKPLSPDEVCPDVSREEDLCANCFRIRIEFRQCPDCGTMTPPGRKCPFGHAAEATEPAHPGVCMSQEEGMVAVVALRIGCDPELMRTESELLLARFRRERPAAEDCIWSGPGLQQVTEPRRQQWAKDGLVLVHGTGGILEYLQAVLEIEKHQREWRDWLMGALHAGAESPRRSADAHFLYRSPLLTVLVVPEEVLRDVYGMLAEDLRDLNLAYRLDIAVCDAKLPIYQALEPVFVRGGGRLEKAERADSVRQAAAGFSEAAKSEYKGLRSTPERINDQLLDRPAFQSAASVLGPLAQKLDGMLSTADAPMTELRILRGGQVRHFQGELAQSLLTWERVGDASASQLSALALFAEQLGRLSPADVDARASLLLELLSRDTMRRIGDAATQRLRELADQVPHALSLRQLASFLREVAAHRS